ncbi:hypothetical protein AMTRI_Chr05g64230 [Amborella trichopoda]
MASVFHALRHFFSTPPPEQVLTKFTLVLSLSLQSLLSLFLQEDESTTQPDSTNSSPKTKGFRSHDAFPDDDLTTKIFATTSNPSDKCKPPNFVDNHHNFGSDSVQSSPESGPFSPESTNQMRAPVDIKPTYKAIAPLAVAMAPSAFALAMRLPLKSNQIYVLTALLNIYLVIFMISVELVLLIVFIPHSITGMVVMKGLLGLGIGLFAMAFPLQVLLSLPHNISWLVGLLCGVAVFMAAFLFYLTMRVQGAAKEERENIEV